MKEIHIMKRFIKPFIIILLTGILVNSCEEDFFSSNSLRGTWSVTENSTTFGEQSFTVGIDYYQGDSTKITIDNFSNLGLNVEVIGNLSDRSIIIPLQSVRDANNNLFNISGSGIISTNFRKIDLNYSYDGTSFTAVFQKQF